MEKKRGAPRVPANFALNFPSAELTVVEFEAAYAPRRLGSVRVTYITSSEASSGRAEKQTYCRPSGLGPYCPARSCGSITNLAMRGFLPGR
jgi:hypothetical protein